MRVHFFSLMAVCVFGSFFTPFACSWIGGFPPSCAVYSQAELVFEGKVVELSKNRTEPDEEITVTFSVEKMYKGTTSGIASIQATVSMCTQKYETNQQYLIYANRNPKNQFREIRAIRLANQDRIKNASQDYEYLQNLAEGKATNSINGFVYEYINNNKPVKDVLISIEGEGKSYKTITKPNGYFLITNVQPGTYKIRCSVLAPTLIVIDKKEMRSLNDQKFNKAEIEVTVPAVGCSYTQFALWTPSAK